MARRALLLAALAAPTLSWIAVTPADASGSVDVIELSDAGVKTADIATFKIRKGEVIDPNAWACGRCFCLLLGTNVAAQKSTLYNMSFCLVPTPALESTLSLPGLAYNLHSAEGEGDGGSGYTLFINNTAAPRSFHVAHVDGRAVTQLVDVSAFVDDFDGAVFPGGTAFCAETRTMWVAVRTRNPAHDTLLTVDVGGRAVTGNVSIPKPALASHFADCSTNSVGGLTQTAPDARGVSAILVGMLDAATGAFAQLDAVPLPAGSALALSGIADFYHGKKWAQSEYGAILYTKGRLPGALLTSSGGKSGPGKVAPLGVAVAAVAVEY